jgi:hypothetical protein
MARSAGPNELQTSIRLSRELYDRLDAGREGRPLGEEMRRRLEASFSSSPPPGGDPRTGTLLNHVAAIADVVRVNFGDWQTMPGACAIFRRAIDISLAEIQPEGEPVVAPTPQAPKFMQECNSVDDAARMVAAAALWAQGGQL